MVEALKFSFHYCTLQVIKNLVNMTYFPSVKKIYINKNPWDWFGSPLKGIGGPWQLVGMGSWEWVQRNQAQCPIKNFAYQDHNFSFLEHPHQLIHNFYLFYKKKHVFFYFTHQFLQNTHINLSILHIYSIKYFKPSHYQSNQYPRIKIIKTH